MEVGKMGRTLKGEQSNIDKVYKVIYDSYYLHNRNYITNYEISKLTGLSPTQVTYACNYMDWVHKKQGKPKKIQYVGRVGMHSAWTVADKPIVSIKQRPVSCKDCIFYRRRNFPECMYPAKQKVLEDNEAPDCPYYREKTGEVYVEGTSKV